MHLLHCLTSRENLKFHSTYPEVDPINTTQRHRVSAQAKKKMRRLWRIATSSPLSGMAGCPNSVAQV